MDCSNCMKPSGPDALRLTLSGEVIAEICGECQAGVSVAKIVLTREDKGKSLAYEGYLPVAMVK